MPKPLSLLSLKLNTILPCKVWNSQWSLDRHISLLYVSVPPSPDKAICHGEGLRDTQISPHSTILDKWPLECLSHNTLIVRYIVSILTAVRIHTTPILSVLKNLFAFQIWKCWERSSAKVGCLQDWRTIRILLQNIAVEWMHYLIWNHVNVTGTEGIKCWSVSMDSVW